MLVRWSQHKRNHLTIAKVKIKKVLFYLFSFYLSSCSYQSESKAPVITPIDSIKNEKANKYMLKGISLAINNDYQAIKLFDSCILQDPDFSPCYSERAEAEARLQNFHEALIDCNKAVELSPNKESVYYLRAQIQFHYKRYDKVLEDLEKCEDLTPNSPKAAYGKIQVYAATAEYQKALKNCTKLIKLYPKAFEPYMLQGEIYRALGLHQKACESYLKARDLGGSVSPEQIKSCI